MYFIKQAAQLKVLESATRLEILDAVAADGPCSIADLAVELGKTPESLYPHVKKMLSVGLVKEAGERSLEGRSELLYATPSRRMAIGTRPLSKARREALVRISRSCARVAQRDLELNMRQPDWIEVGPERNGHWSRNKGWFTPDELAELNELLSRIEDLAERGRRRPGTEPLAVSLSLSRCRVGHSPRSKEST
jgi:DNA-binding transcriptional ArsR family regulator